MSKKLISTNGYVQLIDNDKDIQQGFQYGELMYKIKGDSISFYYNEDYLYDNVLFTAFVPKFVVDGAIYPKDQIGNALDTIFVGNNGAVIAGDMFKSQYDTNDDGVVDNSQKLDGYSVDELPISDAVQAKLDELEARIAVLEP